MSPEDGGMVTYAKLEDDFPENVKVVGLSDAAFRLYVTALCYCSRNLTDGFIPAGAMQRLGGKSKTTMELTVANLWHGEAGPIAGWRIHDYLEHQRSRDEIEGIRHTKALAGAKGGAKAALSRRYGNGDSKRVPRGQLQRTTTETETDLNSSSLSAGARNARDWFEALNHRAPPNAILRETLANIDTAHPPDCIRAIFEASADKDDPWRYAKAVFDTCLIEGHEPRVKEKRDGRATNVGANQGGRSVRQGDGRHIPASQRVPGAGVDYDAAEREHERIIAGAIGRVAGLPAEEMGQDV